MSVVNDVAGKLLSLPESACAAAAPTASSESIHVTSFIAVLLSLFFGMTQRKHPAPTAIPAQPKPGADRPWGFVRVARGLSPH